jgi:hypothetical protein
MISVFNINAFNKMLFILMICKFADNPHTGEAVKCVNSLSYNDLALLVGAGSKRKIRDVAVV